MHYIYIIANAINSKVYIGQTKYPEKRWRQHQYMANKTTKHQHIHRAMAKDRISNFTFNIIDYGIDQSQADCLEINYIAQYDSRNPEKGYNHRIGGYVSERSEETRQKISLTKTGVPRSEEANRKNSETMKKKCDEGWVPKTLFTIGSEATKYWSGKESPQKIKLSQDELQNAICFYGNGQSLTEISKIIGVEERIVSRELKSNGIVISNKGKHNSTTTEFKKGMVSYNKGKKMGPAWNKGKTIKLSNEQLQEVNKLLHDGLSLRSISKLVHIDRKIISRELKTNKG